VQKLSARAVIAVLMFAVLIPVVKIQADDSTLGASKDNTLYEHSTGALSNGAGQHIFVGKTSSQAT
jgi:hypothetical protein